MFYQNKRNNEQSRETDNIGYTRQRKTKHNTEKLTTQGTQDKEKQNTTQYNMCWTQLYVNKHN